MGTARRRRGNEKATIIQEASKDPAESENIPKADLGWDCFAGIDIVTACVVIAVFAGLLNVNTLKGGFVYDDARGVVSNADVPGDQPLTNLFANDFWGKPMARYQSHKSYRYGLAVGE